MDAGDFVLPVDKPEGPTSHDVVAMARRGLGTRRVGHTGTLDPFASGLLVLCVGQATRLAEYLSGLDKCYLAEARLGVSTDTLDRDGTVVAECDQWADLRDEAIREVLGSFVGEIQQVPPQFSAKKVDGEAMHRKARRGESVELPAVPVTLYAVELMAVRLPLVRFSVRCSTGTYVRALARDLGEVLGVGAHLTSLRRTRVGDFDVAGAVPAGELGDRGRVEESRVPPIAALGHIPGVTADADEAVRLRHGQRVRMVEVPETGPAGGLVTVSHGDDLVAIARLVDGVLQPAKVFPA